MRITDILKPVMVIPELRADAKDDVLGEMAAHLCRPGDGSGAETGLDPEVVRSALMARERLGSTGVGEGVAIPHAKIPGLKTLVACFGRRPSGVPFDAIDQQPVRLFFVLLVPEHSAGVHLKALARVSRLLKNAAFRDRLLSLDEAPAIYKAFTEEDSKYP